MTIWMERILNLELPDTANSYAPTVVSTWAVIAKGGIIDFIPLLEMTVPLNAGQLAVVLRSTFALRRNTNGWVQARDRAIIECEREGHDPQDMLSGMLEVTEEIKDEDEAHGLIRDLMLGGHV